MVVAIFNLIVNLVGVISKMIGLPIALWLRVGGNLRFGYFFARDQHFKILLCAVANVPNKLSCAKWLYSLDISGAKVT